LGLVLKRRMVKSMLMKRDLSVIFGLDFDWLTALNWIRGWRDMSVVVGLDYERLTVHCLIGEATLGWRDWSVIFGHVLETARYSDRGSIHAWRATSVIFGLVMKSFTVMTWTPDSIETWRDMSVIVGLISERATILTATRFTLGGI